MTEYPSGMQLFAAPDDELSVAEAKEYLKANGYDASTVRLVKADGQIRAIRR